MLKFLVFLGLLQTIQCEFACTAIHTDFEIVSSITQRTALNGSYEYFVKQTDDGRNVLVVAPLKIYYDDFNSTRNEAYYLTYQLNYRDNVTTCNYTAIPNSQCVTFGGSGGYILIRTNSLYIVGDAVLIDGGIINMEHGAYIGIDNPNPQMQGWTHGFNFTFKYQRSKCKGYTALPEVKPNLSKCRELISDTLITNITKNNEEENIVAINVIYTLNSMMTANATFKNLSSSVSSFFFSIDDHGGAMDDGNYWVGKKSFQKDQKTLLGATFWFNGGYSKDIRIGQFFYRNGAVLMDEETPFTPDNYCHEQTRMLTWSDNFNFRVTTTFCCSLFSN